MSSLSSTEIHTIITDPDGAETLVTAADRLGQELKTAGLTTSQVRSLFGELRAIEAQWSADGADQRKAALRRLVLLKPKMAYRARRERGRGVQQLVEVLDCAVDEVIHEPDPEQRSQHFARFVEFFEAILAYHKAYGGS